MVKRIAVSAVAVISISLLTYFFLGGFSPVEFETVNRNLKVYGEEFIGGAKDIKLEQLFTKARNSLKEDQNEQLVVIDYFLASEDSVRLFVGVISESRMERASIELEKNFVEGQITAHPLVRPLPNKIRDLATEYAASKNLKLDSFSVEIYHPNEELEVLFATIEN